MIIKIFHRTYKIFSSFIFSPFIASGYGCRYQPTCSDYMYEAIEKRGIIRGLLMGIKRVLRCHPWSEGGYDPVE